jgi:hypothetical protein
MSVIPFSVPRKREDDNVQFPCSPTSPSLPQQRTTLGVPLRPGLIGESDRRVPSARCGDVPPCTSRRRGTVRLDDLAAE